MVFPSRRISSVHPKAESVLEDTKQMIDVTELAC